MKSFSTWILIECLKLSRSVASVSTVYILIHHGNRLFRPPVSRVNQWDNLNTEDCIHPTQLFREPNHLLLFSSRISSPSSSTYSTLAESLDQCISYLKCGSYQTFQFGKPINTTTIFYEINKNKVALNIKNSCCLFITIIIIIINIIIVSYLCLYFCGQHNYSE